MTAWAANLESTSTFFYLDSESFRNTTDPTLLAQQQRHYIRYDTFASVYQFTQVNRLCLSFMFSCRSVRVLHRALFCHDVTPAQPVCVLSLQLAKLLILERMMKVVTRQKTRTLDRIRRLSRAFVAMVVLGNMVRRLLPATMMSKVTLNGFSTYTSMPPVTHVMPLTAYLMPPSKIFTQLASSFIPDRHSR